MARILVVDDVPESVRLIAMVLKAEKHDVDMVESAAAALALLKSKPFDVIICDQNMPGVTGEALLDRVAVLWPGIARLMLTADPRVRSEPGRGYTVLHKPFRMAELRAEVIRVLGAR